jgi:Flp pilus assembly protein TadD
MGQAQDTTAAAIDAFERGDLAGAEQMLEASIKSDPHDAAPLQVLAMVLDREKKYGQAEDVYRRALALAPQSPGLLNNYGNHLLSLGRASEARRVFLAVIAVEPEHPNANEQLARIAIRQRRPAEALARLEHLPAEAQQSFDAELLRGEALAALKRYPAAEQSFSAALQYQPDNFDALYGLGLAASHAGDSDRARDALRRALAVQPQNADVLYDLAAAEIQAGQREPALELLGRAKDLAPARKDVRLLLARTLADLGYFGDAVQAWDDYLRLSPGDAVARRERAFAESAMGKDPEAALAELANFAHTHPENAAGHYELGTAESANNPKAALSELNRAILLQPALTPAYFARGLVRYRLGDLEGARADFAFAVRKEPSNAAALDRLAEVDLAMDRAEDALPLLRKAAALAPDDARVELHLGHALERTGKQSEAADAFKRYRELKAGEENVPHATGLLDFVGLSPAEQYARYRAGVERAVKENPENAEAQVRHLGIVLSDGNVLAARQICQQLAALHPAAGDLEQAARELLQAGQNGLAEDLLNQAGATASAPRFQILLAAAELQTSGAAAAKKILDGIPEAARSAEYYLVVAKVLAASGRQADAQRMIGSMEDARGNSPECFAEAALLLANSGRIAEAAQLLARGSAKFPDNDELRALRVLALEAQTAAAADREAVLGAMQAAARESPYP